MSKAGGKPARRAMIGWWKLKFPIDRSASEWLIAGRADQPARRF